MIGKSHLGWQALDDKGAQRSSYYESTRVGRTVNVLGTYRRVQKSTHCWILGGLQSNPWPYIPSRTPQKWNAVNSPNSLNLPDSVVKLMKPPLCLDTSGNIHCEMGEHCEIGEMGET